jgi:hypothetical protein
MRAAVFRQVPYTNVSPSVAANDFTLIGMYNHVIDGRPMSITSLHRAATSFPDLDRPILRASDHPLPFAVKCYTGNIASVPLEREYRIGVRRLDVVELDIMMARRRKEAFIGRYTESVYLRLGMLDSS